MDLRAPRRDGLAIRRLIEAELPEIRVVMLATPTVDAGSFEVPLSGANG